MTSHDYPLTVKNVLVRAMDRFDEQIALISDGQQLTYRELKDRANQLANALVERGVGPGTPVALMMPNCFEYVIGDQALVRVGAIKVPLNQMLSEAEAHFILEDSGATVAIGSGPLLQAAYSSTAPTLQLVVDASGEQPSESVAGKEVVTLAAFTDGQPTTVPAVNPTEDDLALIIYTGGTTGRSKGVLHSHRGLAQNIFSHVIETEIVQSDRLLLCSPLPHSAGLHLQAGLMQGATSYIESAFDPEVFLSRITDDKVTFTFMVPTMIYRMLDTAEGRDLDFSSLKTIMYGAAPITRDRLEQGLRVFGNVFVQLYGQSEGPNFITRLRRDDHRVEPECVHRLTSCGQAVAMSEVRIIAPDSGGPDEAPTELPRGEIGEVAALTPYNMLRYHGLPEATAKSLRGGWLCTGDIGRMDEDGYVYLLDRKNDMIITGGMNVYSTEVEGVIASVEGVAQVAVVGLPDSDWGEAVTAVVIPAPGSDLDRLRADVIAACKAQLGKYKVPKGVEFADALPLTTIGKVDKKLLRSKLSPGS